MKNIRMYILVLFSVSLLSACAISDLSRLSDRAKMASTIQDVNEVSDKLDTYNSVKGAIDTADEVAGIVTSAGNSQENPQQKESDKTKLSE